MLRADLDRDQIVVSCSQKREEQLLMAVNRIPGAKRQVGGTRTLPLTLDSCDALRKLHFIFSTELAQAENRLTAIRRYISKVKTSDDPIEPLQPPPIKKPFALYQHQVRAYNIALAIFGRGAKKQKGGGRG